MPVDSQPQAPLSSRSGVAGQFQVSLVLVDDLATKELCREVVLRPNKSSHDKVLRKLSTSATQLPGKVRAFEVSIDDAGTTKRVEEGYYIFPGYATLNV
jgi:hypothetical protein